MACCGVLQVLHLCAVVAPNHDTTFSLSIVWTAVQMLASSFFLNFNLVRVWLCVCVRWSQCWCWLHTHEHVGTASTRLVRSQHRSQSKQLVVG